MTVELLDDAASEKTCESPQTMKLSKEFNKELQPMELKDNKVRFDQSLTQGKRQNIEVLYEKLAGNLLAY